MEKIKPKKKTESAYTNSPINLSRIVFYIFIYKYILFPFVWYEWCQVETIIKYATSIA